MQLGMGEQIVLGIVAELKADGVGQPQDGLLLAGQKVPALLHAGQAIIARCTIVSSPPPFPASRGRRS